MAAISSSLKHASVRKLAFPITLAAAAVIVICGPVIYRTVSTTGDAAVAAMDNAERAFHAKLERLTGDMTLEEVVTILGPPDRSGATLRPTWRGPGGSPFNQVAIYFHLNGKVRKIRWMKIGHFVWEDSL